MNIGPPYPLPLEGRYATQAFDSLPEDVQSQIKEAWVARGKDQGEVDEAASVESEIRSTLRSDIIEDALAGKSPNPGANVEQVSPAEMADSAFAQAATVPAPQDATTPPGATAQGQQGGQQPQP